MELPTQKLSVVSVFMPVYNHSAFLAEAIESVINQDYSHLHLFIGDDASTDNSADIIKEYALKFPNKITYYINEKNLGVTLNCNKLLSLCDGDYIAFTAGDDIFLPGKISQQVHFMQSHQKCVLSYTNAKVFGDHIPDTLYYGAFPARRAYETANGDISLFMRQRNFIAGCTIMARRNSFPTGFYNPDIATLSDWLFFTEVASQGDVLYINKILSGYRRHPKSLTTRYLPVIEFEKTYTLLKEKFSTYENDIDAGLARLYLSYAGYYALKKDFDNVRQMLKKLLSILKRNWALLFFLCKCFIEDCFRYAYRLLRQGWSL